MNSILNAVLSGILKNFLRKIFIELLLILRG